MHRCHVPNSDLAAAPSGCVVEPDLLNSERIEARFGSYGIDVLDFADGIRRANLYSRDAGSADGVKTCRTYAVVQFENAADGSLNAAHEQIVRGDSIGAAFRQHGWQVYKETLHAGGLRIPPSRPAIISLMRIGHYRELALHVYRLFVHKRDRTLRYAVVIEAHHPDYLGRKEIEQAYLSDARAPMTREALSDLTRLVLG